jgi:hypothetical protein
MTKPDLTAIWSHFGNRSKVLMILGKTIIEERQSVFRIFESQKVNELRPESMLIGRA